MSVLNAHTLLIVSGAMVTLTSLLALLSADMRSFSSQRAPVAG